MILTVLLNNLGSTFNAFVTAKQQSIRVTTPSFDALAAELIDEACMEDNQGSIAMTARGTSNRGSSTPRFGTPIQCSHCNKKGHDEPNCFVKYPHKEREFKAKKAAKDKGKSSGNNANSNDAKSSPSMLGFMASADPHTVGAWIIDTGVSDHITGAWESFSTYEQVTRVLKTANGPTHIIGKGTVPIQLI